MIHRVRRRALEKSGGGSPPSSSTAALISTTAIFCPTWIDWRMHSGSSTTASGDVEDPEIRCCLRKSRSHPTSTFGSDMDPQRDIMASPAYKRA